MATGLQQGKDSGPGGGTSQRPSGRTPRCRTLGLAVVAALAASPAVQAGPEGGRVVAGSATITQTTPIRLDVVQSSGKAIVDWRSFSIGAGEQTHFQQPSSASVALNRVKGGDPSRILGQLTANGQVMLVNPNGVFFGPGSRVDVGALMASTADIANDDFLAGRYRFTTPSPNPNAGIVHQGEIRAADGGFVVLAAPYVRNEGSIQARLGQVVLAGAPTFTVDFDGDGLLQFDVGGPVTVAPRGDDGQAVDALVANLGTVQADGGRVTLTARAADQVIDRVIHMGGVVQAQTVESRGGEIVLGGGEVGTVAVSGTLDASGPAAGQRGGTVKVLGEKVGLLDGARVDASGGAGGGKVLVGGNFRGQGPEQNARRTYVARGARLDASALGRGDGGQVIVWADEAAAVYGQVSAAGGSAGGDGGLIELSGKLHLAFDADVDLGAPRGHPGTLFLDPLNIRIVAEGEDDAEVADGEVLAGDRPGDALTLSETALESLAGNMNVVLEATDSITIDALEDRVLGFAAATGSVTFRAGGAFQIGDFLTVETQGGHLAIDAAVLTAAPQSFGSLALRTNGGSISVQARTGAVDGAIYLLTDSSSANGRGGDISVSAAGDLSMKGRDINVDARGTLGGGEVSLSSGTGVVDIGDVDTSSTAGQGGGLAISAAGDVRTGALMTSGGAGGGAVTVTSHAGSIVTDFATEGFPYNPINASSGSGPAGAVTLSAAGDIAVGTVDARGVGGGDVTLTAAALLLTDAQGIAGSGALRVQPPSPDDAIAIGTAPEGFEGLALSQLLLNRVSDGFASLTIGREDGRHAISIVDVTFALPVTIQTPDGGQTVIDATEGTTGLFGNGSVTVIGSGGTTFLNAGIRTSGQPIVIRDSVVLGGPVTLDTAGGGISLLGALDGAFPLTLAAGVGDVTFGGPVGGSAAPTAVDVASARNVLIDARFAAGGLWLNQTGDASSGGDALDVGTLYLNPAAASANLFGRVAGRSGREAAQATEGPRGDPDFRVNGYIVGLADIPVITPSVFPFGSSLLAEPQTTGGQPLRLPTPLMWVVAGPRFLAGDPSEAQFSNFGNEELWGEVRGAEAQVR